VTTTRKTRNLLRTSTGAAFRYFAAGFLAFFALGVKGLGGVVNILRKTSRSSVVGGSGCLSGLFMGYTYG